MIPKYNLETESPERPQGRFGHQLMISSTWLLLGKSPWTIGTICKNAACSMWVVVKIMVPSWGTLNLRFCIITGTPKRTIILTIPHVKAAPSLLLRSTSTSHPRLFTRYRLHILNLCSLKDSHRCWWFLAWLSSSVLLESGAMPQESARS